MKQKQIHRSGVVAGGRGEWGMGETGEGAKEVQTSSYKINVL